MRRSSSFLLFSLFLASLAEAQIPPSLDPLFLGHFGFRSTSGQSLAYVAGRDFSGRNLHVEIAPYRPAIVFFFDASYGASAKSLEALEKIRKSKEGSLAIFAVSADPPSRVAACLGSLATEIPIYASSSCAIGLGFFASQSFALIAPGGAIVAFRDGIFDWSSEEGLILLDYFLKTYPPRPLLESAQRGASPEKPFGEAPPVYLSDMEISVLEELNIARSDPYAYADYLREFESRIVGSLVEYPDEMALRLVEGKKAVDEAIAFLSRQPSLPPLRPVLGLSLAARELVREQANSGAWGSLGANSSRPEDRIARQGRASSPIGEIRSYALESARRIVVSLIVDDGLISRADRAAIFDPEFRFAGLAFGPHPLLGNVLVVDFAADFSEWRGLGR